ncbi:MAG: MaoC family dehydratase [Kribbellaceae bacterium]|nr:MaoC family dehydratase [Kribbellaceae bacterium]
MKTFRGIDDLRNSLGAHIGYSSWHRIDQQRIDQFADATGDHQWIHVDGARAASGPFGVTIAHGYLTLSLLPAMCWEVFRVDGLRMEINYGSNRVRFPSVVPVDSHLRGGIELLSLDAAGEGYHLISRVTVEREGGDKPACVAETVAYLVPA